MKSNHEQIVGLIDRAAKAAGSQAAAARAAGLSVQHVSHWRTGLTEPTPEGIAALAHVAELDAMEWLARATLWRSEGKGYAGVLKAALGERLRATGAVIASFIGVVALAPLVDTTNNLRCIDC